MSGSKYFGFRLGIHSFVLGLIGVAIQCNATSIAGLPHETSTVEVGNAQPVDNQISAPQTQSAESSESAIAGPADEIGTEIRFVSSCVTVGVVLFTLGVIGFVTFNPVPLQECGRRQMPSDAKFQTLT